MSRHKFAKEDDKYYHWPMLSRIFLLTFSSVAFSVALSALESRYEIVVDAGSSGSRLTIFEIHQDERNVLKIVPMDAAKEKKAGGIHTAADLSQLSRYLDPLIDFALGHLKDREVAAQDVAVLFRATAGMRSLDQEHQKNILGAVKSHFRKRGFDRIDAAVIGGVEEGIFAWIAANYLLHKLNEISVYDTFGIIEMGGASMQITFMPLDIPKENGVRLLLGKQTYDLYTFSYDEAGQARAMIAMGKPSCFQKGLDKDLELLDGEKSLKIARGAQGSFQGCKMNLLSHLREACHDLLECGLQNAYQPPLRGDFIAMGGFAQFERVFRLPTFSAASLDRFGQKACNMPWAKFKEEYKDADLPKFLATACFEAAYYSAILSGHDRWNGYGFAPETDSISATTRIGGQEIGWGLGLVVFDALQGRIESLPPLKAESREEF